MGLENEYDQTGHISSDFEAYKSIVLKCRDKTDDELRKDHQARLDKEEERCQQIRKNRDQAWIMQYKQEAEPIKTKLLHNGFGIDEVFYLHVRFGERDAAKKKGCKWDPGKRRWYIDSITNIESMPDKWFLRYRHGEDDHI